MINWQKSTALLNLLWLRRAVLYAMFFLSIDYWNGKIGAVQFVIRKGSMTTYERESTESMA